MTSAAVTDLEQEIIDLLADDDELHVGESLTVLLHVVAGICALATTQTPDALAAHFGEQLQVAVAQAGALRVRPS